MRPARAQDSVAVARADGGPREAAYRPRANPTFASPAWTSASLRVLIARLSPYEVASRSFTHLLLAHEARLASPDVHIDMLFLPGPRGRETVSVHAGRPAGMFDLILLSNAYLMELVNVPLLLESSGIPRYARDRMGGSPVVILGGANATAAGALMRPDQNGEGWSSCVDALYLGEGERGVRRIVELCVRERPAGRASTLAALAESLTGLWVPALGDPPATLRRAVCTRPSAADLPTTYPVLDGPEASTARLQISWGCPALCAFCFESWDRRPYREAEVDGLVEAARRLKRSTGAVHLEVFSFNFSTHASFPELTLRLGRIFASVSFMSQRADVLARNPELLRFEMAAGKRTFTLGIEGISPRLRAYLDKGYAEGDLDLILDQMRQEHVREIKLFYIITGHETDRDLARLAAFLDRHRGGNGSPRLIASFTWLLVMPHTPLGHEPPLLDRERVEGIAARLESLVRSRGVEFRLAGDWDEHLACQLLATTGHAAHSLLGRLAATGRWYEGKAAREHGEAARRWLDENPDWRTRTVFAFEGVGGLPDPALLRARHRAARDALEGNAAPGAAPAARVHTSLDIGALETLAREKQARERAALTTVVELPDEVADAGPSWREAWAMRRLLHARPELVEVVLRAEVLALPEPELKGPWCGEAIVRVVSWTDVAPWPGADGRPWPRGAEIEELTATIRIPEDLQVTRSALSRFLVTIRVPVVMERDGDAYTAAAGKGVDRRRSLRTARLVGVEGGTLLTVRTGPRLPLRRFLDGLGYPGLAFRVSELRPRPPGRSP